jgi:hypothetical protein
MILDRKTNPPMPDPKAHLPTRILWCRQGGLMEDPGWHWEQMGEGRGNTVREVADDFAEHNPKFAEYYDREFLSYWGWTLALNPHVED